jgi:hypothetical protein
MEMVLVDIGWIHFAQDNDQWHALVNMAMNLEVA